MSTSQEADVQRKKKLRAYAKGRFHRIKRRFTESNHENEQVSVLTELCRDLEKSYSELEIQNSEYMLHLDDEKDQVKIQELHDEMESIYGELYEVKSELSRKTKNAKAQTDSKEKFKSPLQSGLKVKKLDSPQFSGIIRDYPSFKHDYDRHMIPSFGLDPFALKKCLSGEALSTVKGVDDDFNEMFRRLDLKYGRPEKLSDAVLQELKGLTALRDGDNQGFIKMVDVIENCWLDLRKAGLESEMNTSTMVSQIEKLLPSVQKKEWVIMKQQLKSSEYREIFKSFLEFLLREKMALEYMENEFRKEGNTTRDRVHLASGDGSSTEAQTDQITDKLDLVLNQVVEGLAQVAEVMGTKKDGNESMWRGGNSARRWKCWYHNVDTHEIGKCTGFANLDLNEKMDQLRRNGGCFSCLKQGHLSSRCHDRKKCEVQGCDKMHHSVPLTKKIYTKLYVSYM
ncbi:hypothetical protein FSP39_009560 [Pinctada imbricata]|uniref:CCHC-type domain-containing protein n=1 Tax=Pinctada imbricata TaxID=66713 RepID=A0AA89BWX0_PINIB|nr:hypothetical protein FSP39_009560 [Pinctada imbricata]